MKKRLISIAASAALLFTTAFCGLSAPVHATDKASNSPFKVVEDDHTFYRDPETGHIYTDNADDGYISDNSGKKKSSASLPASYGSFSTIKSTYPNTRNQNPYGTCWAHAATACAEFDLVKNHSMPKTSADFSELQLSYLTYNTGYTLPGLDDDQVYIPSNASRDYLDMGGNILYSMQTMAQWKCFSYESNLPYSNVVNNRYYNVNSLLSGWGNNTYHNAAQLRNVRMLNIKSDPASVKEAIMKYGAVYISYHHDSSYYSLNKYSLYYNPYSMVTNHDVVIVGWDDNIPSANFPAGKRPQSNGAWLVRNSWSTDQSVGSEYTYFYMSYEDATLASTAYVLDFEAYSSNDNIYQHDGSTTHSYLYTNAVANVFTANSPMDKASERLDSVMISFMGSENVNYKVEVYTGVNSSNPQSGVLNSAATTTGRTTSRGIYTIDLASPVYLAPGERYSIVVSTSNGYSTYFDVESSEQVYYYENGIKQAWFTSRASADTGESYLNNYGTWQDAASYGYGNVCVKAITSDSTTAKYTITYNMNGGTNNSQNPVSFFSTQSGTCTLQNPTRSGYHFLGWYSDAGFKNRVYSVNYNNKSNQTLYARWCSDSNPYNTTVIQYANKNSDGSYQITCQGCGLLKGSYTAPAISSIKLNYTKLTYSGSNKNPVPVIKTRDGGTLTAGTDYTYSYNKTSRKNVGRYNVKINFKGVYNETPKTLYFTIVPKAPSSGSAKLYGYNDIKVSWGKVTGASGYYVYYKKSSASSYTKYKTTTSRTLKFKNMSGNTKYNFKIVPYYKSGNTKYKSTKSRIVSATTLKKLNQPTIKKASGGRVSLNWQCIKGASGYQVYWAKTKKGKYTKLCDYSNAYIGITFTVGKNQTYWYKTRAYKKVDGKKIYGPWSTPKSYKLK